MEKNKDKSKIYNKIKGEYGEIIAVKFLKRHKYKILLTNYRNYIGEIDVIAKKDKKIIFVEVKRRMGYAYGRPIEAVDARKQKKIKQTAEIFLMMNNLTDVDVRFDVVEIVDEEVVSLVEDAFR